MIIACRSNCVHNMPIFILHVLPVERSVFKLCRAFNLLLLLNIRSTIIDVQFIKYIMQYNNYIYNL